MSQSDVLCPECILNLEETLRDLELTSRHPLPRLPHVLFPLPPAACPVLLRYVRRHRGWPWRTCGNPRLCNYLFIAIREY
jgi:hypothetical protein